MMTDKFLDTVKKYSMFSPGDRVVVGLSGGPDSMCLMHLLLRFAPVLGITPEAAHVNHCIRGAEADGDENFVRDFCRGKGIRLHVLKVDVPAKSRESGESTELAARKIRYDYFNSLKADKIATAHTGSDCIETMFINLSRGASLHGLASIPPVRGNIVRPLISCTRAEIEAYCEKNFLAFVTDSTNLSDGYTRNKFRHNVLPQFRAINPDFENAALRCLNLLRQDDAFLSAEAEKIVCDNILADGSLSVVGLSGIHESMLKRVIAIYLTKRLNAEYESRHIEMLAQNIDNKFSVMLPGKMKLSCDGKRLFHDVERSMEKPAETAFNKDGSVGFIYCGKKYTVNAAEALPEKSDNASAVVDYDKVSDIITVRSRRAGDSFTLPGRSCTKTLKKLFNEMRIPPGERDSRAVFSDKNGVIYIEGIGTDLSRLPGKSTRKFLIIKTECGKNE